MLRTSNHARHPGLTLLEAMIAMGVAAIGMLALLVLFPLGALQMGQALKDERTSQCAMQADGLLRTAYRGYVEGSATDANLFGAFDNPGNGAAQITGGAQPSYPVFLDPIGYLSRSAPARDYVAGLNYLPRRNFAFISSLSGAAPNAIRFCTLLDDMTYEDTGSGQPYFTGAGNNKRIERQGRYNWLAVLQRSNYQVATPTRLTVVVFDGRAPGYAPTGSETTVTASAAVTPGTTSVSLPYSATLQGITKGRWLMDATASVTQGGNTVNLRHANFYRIASVNTDSINDPVAANQKFEIELEKPIVRNDGGTAAFTPTFVVLTGAAEVFERPALSDR